MGQAQGPTVASTPLWNSEGGASGDSISQHQARLKAALLAASMYRKSSIYPSTNTSFGYSGYALLPQINILATDASTPGFRKIIRGAAGQLLQKNGFPHVLMPYQMPSSGLSCLTALDSADLRSKAYESSIQYRIQCRISHPYLPDVK